MGRLKVVEVVKANYAMPPAPRLFRRPLDGAIEWLGEAGITVEECFQPPKRGSGGTVPAARMQAEALLKELLRGGSVRVTEVVRDVTRGDVSRGELDVSATGEVRLFGQPVRQLGRLLARQQCRHADRPAGGCAAGGR